MQKSELRKQKLRDRDTLSPEERRAKSERICKKIAETLEFTDSGTIMLYKYIRSEVQLTDYRNLILPPEKSSLLPRLTWSYARVLLSMPPAIVWVWVPVSMTGFF